MKKTHKKILGFAGIGLVAAATTVAAILPPPAATAVSTVTDTIQVNVVQARPDITISSDKGDKVTDPNYSFQITYNEIGATKITIVNKDSDGDVIYSGDLFDESLNFEAGSKTFDLDLNTLGGYGDFTITVVGNDADNVPIERILSFKYSKADESGNPDEGGDVIIEPDIPEEKVVTIDVVVYDDTRQTIVKNDIPTFTDLSSGEINVDLSSLPNGWYWLKITSKNKNGNIIKEDWQHVLVNKAPGQDIKIVTPVPGDLVDLDHITNTITNEAGYHWEARKDNPVPGQDITWDLPHDLDPGLYTMTLRYYNTAGEIIKTEVSTFLISKDTGEVDVPIERRIDTVTTIETNIYDDKDGSLARRVVIDRASGVAQVYDKDGKLLFTLPNALRGGKVVIPMAGLPAGDYTAIISFKNKYGDLVGDTIRVKIHWNGDKAVIVPDTGGFFQGLNISREDYLITGLVVFMVVGVVAFGVVARNKRNRR